MASTRLLLVCAFGLVHGGYFDSGRQRGMTGHSAAVTVGSDGSLAQTSDEQIEGANVVEAAGSETSAEAALTESTARQARIEKLEEDVAHSLNIAVTPGMKVFLDTVDSLVSQMKESVNSEHARHQEQLLAAGKAFDHCRNGTGAWASSIHHAWNNATEKGKVHRQCRYQEDKLFWQAQCNDTVQKWKIRKSTICNWLNGTNHSQMDPGRCIPRFPNETVLVYLERLKQDFDSRLAMYEDVEAECRNVTNRYYEERNRCQNATGRWEVKAGECDREQEEMDISYCAARSVDNGPCVAYTTCYDNAKATYDSLMANARELESDRKKEWVLISSLNCLVDSRINTTAEIAGDDLSSCKTTVHYTGHLNLTFPNVPPLNPCNLTDIYPCNTKYLDKEYSGFNATVTLLNCSACGLVPSNV